MTTFVKSYPIHYKMQVSCPSCDAELPCCFCFRSTFPGTKMFPPCGYMIVREQLAVQFGFQSEGVDCTERQADLD